MPQILEENEIELALTRVPRWTRVGSHIERTWIFPGFAQSVDFVNLVASEAEQAEHHPDIDIRWNKVTLRLSTHSAGGLTGYDFGLAQLLDTLPVVEK